MNCLCINWCCNTPLRGFMGSSIGLQIVTAVHSDADFTLKVTSGLLINIVLILAHWSVNSNLPACSFRKGHRRSEEPLEFTREKRVRRSAPNPTKLQRWNPQIVNSPNPPGENTISEQPCLCLPMDNSAASACHYMSCIMTPQQLRALTDRLHR